MHSQLGQATYTDQILQLTIRSATLPREERPQTGNIHVPSMAEVRAGELHEGASGNARVFMKILSVSPHTDLSVDFADALVREAENL